jgi:hypothetical protein
MDYFTGAYNSVEPALNWKHFLIGVAVAALIAILLYFVVDRADTRPVVDGFVGYGVLDTLYSDAPKPVVSEAQTELDELMKKLAVFKADLLSGASSTKVSSSQVTQMQYNAHQDIRPIAEWTAQCFSKNVPERDITLQLEKWFESGKRTIMELGLGEGKIAELSAIIEDVRKVAMEHCVATAHSDIEGVMGLHAPIPYGSAESTTSAQYWI